MKLPDPPLLLITDRHQARLPLVDVVRAALAAGCRWVSVREKDLSEEDQIALALTLLPMARRHGACLTLHGPAALAKACGSDGVHLPAGTNPAASRALLGQSQTIVNGLISPTGTPGQVKISTGPRSSKQRDGKIGRAHV